MFKLNNFKNIIFKEKNMKKTILFILYVFISILFFGNDWYKYKPVISQGNDGAWDEISIYSMAIPSDINNVPILQPDNKYCRLV